MPKSKPTVLHELEGTLRPNRHGDPSLVHPLDKLGDLPHKPEDLPEEASKLWDYLLPEWEKIKLIAKVDACHLEAMCRWWDIYLRAVKEAAAEKDPKLAVVLDRRAQSAYRNFSPLAAEFGMGPSSRANLRTKTKAAAKATEESDEDVMKEFGIFVG